jgi:hypothetical protein
MRKISIIIFISVVMSCSHRRDKFNYDSSIAFVTYRAEMEYLDNRLFFYKTLSEKGGYYNRETELHEKITSGFKEKLILGEEISIKEQKDFLNHFEETFHQSPYINFGRYNELKTIPIKSVSDVDLITRYIKNCFFYILNDNKLLPFDTYGPQACSDKWTITYGESFVYKLSMNAYSSSEPFEWYVVRDREKPLTKENIVDTLTIDETGVVVGQTKKYKKGENNLFIISRLRTAKGDRTLGMTMTFIVK